MKRTLTPVALLTALAAIVLGFGWAHIAHWGAPGKYAGLAILIAYSCWPLLESAAMAREARRGPAEQDRGTYAIYASARAATVLACVGLAPDTGPPTWQLTAGIALLISGMVLRTVAIQTLGGQYSNRVRWDAGSTVISAGPYKVIRHPSYAGMLLGHLGLVTGIGSLAGVAAFTLLFLPAIVKRILVEENVLDGSPDWSAFAASRSRLVPWLW